MFKKDGIIRLKDSEGKHVVIAKLEEGITYSKTHTLLPMTRVSIFPKDSQTPDVFYFAQVDNDYLMAFQFLTNRETDQALMRSYKRYVTQNKSYSPVGLIDHIAKDYFQREFNDNYPDKFPKLFSYKIKWFLATYFRG